MQTQVVIHGPRGPKRNGRCDQAQGFRAKFFLLYCKNNHIKLIFAPVDDHRSMGMVERLIRTLKTEPTVMKIDKRNKPYNRLPMWPNSLKLWEWHQTLLKKITPLEAQLSRKPKTPLSNISTMPKLSILSWAYTKIACLDQRLLNKTRPSSWGDVELRGQ